MKKKKVFKKKLEDFIKDESGNISRDKVLKIGLGTIAALGIMAAFTSDGGNAAIYTSHTSHTNSIGTSPEPPNAGQTSCETIHSSFTAVTDHNSY